MPKPEKKSKEDRDAELQERKANAYTKLQQQRQAVIASLMHLMDWSKPELQGPRGKGRPTMYSENMRDFICILLANGIPMVDICQIENMPSFDTVWKWIMRHGDFAEATAHAREIGTHYLADQCIGIADDPDLDPADKRIMIDARIRLIGKWNQYYSDKQQVHISGQVNLKPVDVGQLDYDQREALQGMLEQIALPSPEDEDL